MQCDFYHCIKRMKRPALTFLNRTALKAFKSWVKLAREQNVRIDIHGIDRQAIYDEFTEAVYEGLDAAYKEHGYPDCFFAQMRFKSYMCGFVMGKLSVRWSYRYLPPPSEHHYLLWIKSFVQLARVDADTRLKANRLFVVNKQIHPTMGSSVPVEQILPRDKDYSAHHVFSDMQADLNWSDFIATFDKHFSAASLLVAQQFKEISFSPNTSILTEKQEDKVFAIWDKSTPSLKTLLADAADYKRI